MKKTISALLLGLASFMALGVSAANYSAAPEQQSAQPQQVQTVNCAPVNVCGPETCVQVPCYTDSVCAPTQVNPVPCAVTPCTTDTVCAPVQCVATPVPVTGCGGC